jgi:hypothetical protein
MVFKKIIKEFFFKKYLFLVCSQIWLNHLTDDCHFSSITKIAPKNNKKKKLKEIKKKPGTDHIRYYQSICAIFYNPT